MTALIRNPRRGERLALICETAQRDGVHDVQQSDFAAQQSLALEAAHHANRRLDGGAGASASARRVM